ncbi:MAG: hiran domain protein [Gammaproteobacteria bacterium]|nr:MAG: hiran domain protein [Gammaproteobacteria bacterium]
MKRSSFIKGIGLATSGLILPGPKSISISNLYTQPVKIYDNYLRGTYYYSLAKVFDALKEGDSILLKRIPEHKHDSFAIEVYWEAEHKLGYIAAYENVVLANLMDAGIKLNAIITEKRMTSQVSIGIWADLVVSGIPGETLTDKRADDQVDIYRGQFSGDDIVE